MELLTGQREDKNADDRSDPAQMCAGFAAVLRRCGVPVSTSQTITFHAAVHELGDFTPAGCSGQGGRCSLQTPPPTLPTHWHSTSIFRRMRPSLIRRPLPNPASVS